MFTSHPIKEDPQTIKKLELLNLILDPIEFQIAAQTKIGIDFSKMAAIKWIRLPEGFCLARFSHPDLGCGIFERNIRDISNFLS